MLAERGRFTGHLPLLRQVAHQILQQASQVFMFEPVFSQKLHFAISISRANRSFADRVSRERMRMQISATHARGRWDFSIFCASA